MKKAIIILSHCNTKEKLQVLKDNISKLKTFQNLDIILTSHISLPQEIVDSVEYFIYDKSNPVLSWPQRGMFFWRRFNTPTHEAYLNYIQPDYGWTVFNQINLGGSITLSQNYNISYFINYDLVIDSNVEDIINDNTQDSKFFKSKNYQEDIMEPSLLLFKVNKPHLNYLINNISIDKYCEAHHTPEQYLNTIIKDLEFTKPDYFISDQIDFFNEKGFEVNNSLHSHFNCFVTDFDFTQWYQHDKGDLYLDSTYFYNITEPITIKYKNTTQTLLPGENYNIKCSECYYNNNGKWELLFNPNTNKKQYISLHEK
tara:strand:+ start:298 stop:1236 length:939 start_codon:yes stop_codon:yes gene_type:complete